LRDRLLAGWRAAVERSTGWARIVDGQEMGR